MQELEFNKMLQNIDDNGGEVKSNPEPEIYFINDKTLATIKNSENMCRKPNDYITTELNKAKMFTNCVFNH